MKMKLYYPETKTIQGTKYIGKWLGKNVPIFDVYSMHGLNQLIGYIKFINAQEGTILYRGQCTLYEHMLPSMYHTPLKIEERIQDLEQIISDILMDDSLRKIFNFATNDINVNKLLIEATLQHYSAKTRCVDFADNHWTALWFGLNRWDDNENSYVKRDQQKPVAEDKWIDFDNRLFEKPKPTQPSHYAAVTLSDLSDTEINWIKNVSAISGKPEEYFIERLLQKKKNHLEKLQRRECNKTRKKVKTAIENIETLKAENARGHLFLFLYLADTNCLSYRGIYNSEHTYVVDLRKALLSIFLRPCSQHGWIVKNKVEAASFDDNVVCVIRMSVELVDDLLGNGKLLTQENFFPTPEVDQGYAILLGRQINSPVNSHTKFKRILPENMLTIFNHSSV